MAKFTLIDSPIDCIADDSLEIARYVEAMYVFIKGCDTPLTIGIQGDWGVGKTSFLNMLRDKFNYAKGREKRCYTIYFNTWQYSQFQQEELLCLSILRGIVANIEKASSEGKKGDKEQIASGAKKFGRFVTQLGNQVVKSQTGLDLDKASAAFREEEASPDLVTLITEAKTQFGDLVQSLIDSKLGDKIVIMIDDLDRLKPIRALEFLEAVKNFLDVPGCVFLIAVDYSVIQRGMEEKLGKDAREMQGKSYFDKIIQVPFNMPTLAYKTDSYIMAMLGWEKSASGFKKKDSADAYLRIGKAIPVQDDADFFVNITRLTVGSNPRSIKRSISYATLLKIILLQSDTIGALNMRRAKVLYSLACLQLAWPEVFSLLTDNPVLKTVQRLQDFDFLESSPQVTSLLKRVHNPEEVKSNITAFFDELLSIVDKDGDGEITRTEFSVIPRIMKAANMMAVELEDLDAMWNVFEKMIRDATKAQALSPEVEKGLRVLRHDKSRWNDQLNLRLVPAGKRFLNVLWAKRQIGTLVTTQKEALQFYIKRDPVAMREMLDSDSDFLTDVRDVGHYGIGDTKVELVKLGQDPLGHEILNRIHEAVFSNNREQPTSG